MEPVPDDQTQKRAHMRDKYSQAVPDLVQALDSQSQDAYRSDELSLEFPLDHSTPRMKIFSIPKPVTLRICPRECLESIFWSSPNLVEALSSTTSKFDEIYDHPMNVKNSPSSYIVAERAYQIFKGLIHGLYHGFQIGILRLCASGREDEEDPATTYPHLMLVMCSVAEATDDELLFGEVGPIMQAIQNRISLTEIEKTSLFRIWHLPHAKFNMSGILKVRASPIYSFRYKMEVSFKLFLKYYACDPRYGPDYKFCSD
ncbi:hypothetical protein N7510_011666 [Penicillium lagena]|uniref:uncharacterized protein n=1 Tax=Penicillium lagena TaxID=94218 RepID=UPI0025409560|nr:uncharacterized protein N7510_011666 [Penicillium lagena]KAJ5602132.1 hypothetical protein N7510_011666 [Penicillium lagena]